MLIGKARSCPFHRCEFPLTFTRAVGQKIQSDLEYSPLNDYKLSVHEVRGIRDRQVGLWVFLRNWHSRAAPERYSELK
jgi:hypothetical protein